MPEEERLTELARRVDAGFEKIHERISVLTEKVAERCGERLALITKIGERTEKCCSAIEQHLARHDAPLEAHKKEEEKRRERELQAERARTNKKLTWMSILVAAVSAGAAVAAVLLRVGAGKP